MAIARIEGAIDNEITYRLISSHNEPKLYVTFYKNDLEVPLPDSVVALDDELKSYRMKSYLNSEDFEFGVELFSKITKLPVEFLTILRSGKISLCCY